MNKKATLIVLLSLILVIIISTFIKTSPYSNNAAIRDFILTPDSENKGYSFLASVQTAAKTAPQSTKKPIIQTGRTLNVFILEPLPIFQLSAPFFSALPLTKNQYLPTKPIAATTSIGSLFNGLTNTTPSTAIKSPIQTYTAINPTLIDKIQTNIQTTTGIKPTTKKPQNSVVNIYCTQKIGSLRKTVTGTGILINADGTILTNAHVAQYPLVAEKNSSVICNVRTGQIAERPHSISTVFISPKWSAKNAPYINTGGTLQTGQSDFALLRIATTDLGRLGLKPVDISYSYPPTGTQVVITSYPVDVLASKPSTTLSMQTDSPTVIKADSFNGGNIVDIIETSPSRLGQRGSSGGLITSLNEMIAMVTIVLEAQGPGQHKPIRAITPTHIHSELSEYVSGGLETISRTGSQSLQTKFALTDKVRLMELFNQYLK